MHKQKFSVRNAGVQGDRSLLHQHLVHRHRGLHAAYRPAPYSAEQNLQRDVRCWETSGGPPYLHERSHWRYVDACVGSSRGTERANHRLQSPVCGRHRGINPEVRDLLVVLYDYFSFFRESWMFEIGHDLELGSS